MGCDSKEKKAQVVTRQWGMMTWGERGKRKGEWLYGLGVVTRVRGYRSLPLPRFGVVCGVCCVIPYEESVDVR